MATELSSMTFIDAVLSLLVKAVLNDDAGIHVGILVGTQILLFMILMMLWPQIAV